MVERFIILAITHNPVNKNPRLCLLDAKIFLILLESYNKGSIVNVKNN
tara:strand:+ start:852 stop:995 length:144 start_codon:yes stop_codon:yes gene_type:complete